MKNNVSILLIVLLILAISNLILFAEEAKYDFRKTNWGMSKEQVKVTEDKKPDYETNIVLGYKVMIDGNDFACIYNFLEDKLYDSLYWYGNISANGQLFIGEHTNKNLYIDDYERLKETLTKKYGKPKIDKIVWKNDLFKDNKQDWGMAISVGHLGYGVIWETSTTTISLILGGDNYKIRLAIGYYSKELKEWANKIKEKETSKGF